MLGWGLARAAAARVLAELVVLDWASVSRSIQVFLRIKHQTIPFRSKTFCIWQLHRRGLLYAKLVQYIYVVRVARSLIECVHFGFLETSEIYGSCTRSKDLNTDFILE